MIVEFYNTNSDPLQVSKYLYNKIELNCNITDEIPTESPVFLLDLTNAKMNRNFAYVPEWGKYYFLDEPNVITGSHIEISGHVDDLMTHRNAILNAQIIADRSSSNFEYYMEDGMIADSGKIITKIRKLPTVFNTTNASNNYVIILGGK